MYRIVMRFFAACAAPTRRFRRTLGTVCLVGAVLLVGVGCLLMERSRAPLFVLSLWGVAFVLLAVALRLALNDVRDVREQYRKTRKELFVTTFSDEEFQRKIREKRAKLAKEAGSRKR